MDSNARDLIYEFVRWEEETEDEVRYLEERIAEINQEYEIRLQSIRMAIGEMGVDINAYFLH